MRIAEIEEKIKGTKFRFEDYDGKKINHNVLIGDGLRLVANNRRSKWKVLFWCNCELVDLFDGKYIELDKILAKYG